ncbi:hypothetical protein RchiOBHm_Chr5g0016221 [Rosa chinensis]|uniref:Uncharacterized protein n=1 Tax=Rosa chinensis TaxID=74649 RepID=A0A2P6Q649_ROSCH|nr:hypothetical protein RchiOBHm_Chr5g0016221 [Rosa chinensis]
MTNPRKKAFGFSDGVFRPNGEHSDETPEVGCSIHIVGMKVQFQHTYYFTF